MLYFEDALWIRENFWKDTIGTLYFVLGFTGIAFHLILISILPEIANFITRPTVLILSAQLLACIVQLFVVFVPVPAMIAVNQPYFVNPVMINVPAFILVLSQTFSFIFIMINGAHRSVKSVSPRVSKIIFLDNVIFGIMIVAFGFSFFFTVNICARTTIRRFNPSKLNWTLQYFEVISYIYLIVLVIIPTLTTHLIALSELSYRKLFQKPLEESEEEDENASSRETICSLSFYAIFDILFCFWISLSFLSSVPILSLSNVFLTAYWPLLTALTLDIHIRSALIYRIRGVFQSANSPIVIQPNKKEAKFSKF
uniref:Serpentine receptor class gamma n=1 Tax=Caenorhabditis tropicalis TaxID=1561998 RepID=A0A1I7V1N9_9PELO